ncbi:hypothetical protein JKP88DRAFT_266219 [Tribonema minus]|uniref:Uncharacterized protein n=1 Tax=Tribonema minus TaxID=303371 RepID=A0A835ZHL7_9STRA|nr:hypothetical protein JKP88DRAFT_266219 [Tribonema minus]
MSSEGGVEVPAGAEDVPVRFKKKKAAARKGVIRRAPGGASDGEADGDDGSASVTVLADLREEQEARRRARGRGTASVIVSNKPKQEANPLVIRGAGVDNEGAPEGGGAPTGASGVGGQSLLQMIDSQFKSGGEAAGGGMPHEKLMESYIEEKLGLKAGGEAEAGGGRS